MPFENSRNHLWTRDHSHSPCVAADACCGARVLKRPSSIAGNPAASSSARIARWPTHLKRLMDREIHDHH
jgi:hypothetical protein